MDCRWFNAQGEPVTTGTLTGYIIKYDPIRTNGRRWTALGPDGRIGPDYATKRDAMEALRIARDENLR